MTLDIGRSPSVASVPIAAGRNSQSARPESNMDQSFELGYTSRGRFRKRKKSYAKRALMPPRRGIGRTHGKRCLKVCNAASLSVFSDEQHGFFGVDFVMRNVQLEVLRIHQRL